MGKLKPSPVDGGVVDLDPTEVGAVDLTKPNPPKRINDMDALKLTFKGQIQARIDALNKEILVVVDMYGRGAIDQPTAFNEYIARKIQIVMLQNI